MSLIEIIVITAIVGIIGVVGFGGYKSNQHNKTLMQECLNDGKKRYECEILLNRGSK